MQDFRFPSSLTLRLDWSELDMFGHVNNVMYFRYLQSSRVHYWELIGLDRMAPGKGTGPMLASTRCDFRQPLFYPGQITVQASIDFIGNTSFGVYHRILNNAGALAAEGHDVIVLFDYGRGEKMRIPEALRQQIELLEGRTYPPPSYS